MNPIILCVCGQVHIVQAFIAEIPVVACPWAPPGQWFLLNGDRYLPAQVHIPRPEAVW